MSLLLLKMLLATFNELLFDLLHFTFHKLFLFLFRLFKLFQLSSEPLDNTLLFIFHSSFLIQIILQFSLDILSVIKLCSIGSWVRLYINRGIQGIITCRVFLNCIFGVIAGIRCGILGRICIHFFQGSTGYGWALFGVGCWVSNICGDIICLILLDCYRCILCRNYGLLLWSKESIKVIKGTIC